MWLFSAKNRSVIAAFLQVGSFVESGCLCFFSGSLPKSWSARWMIVYAVQAGGMRANSTCVPGQRQGQGSRASPVLSPCDHFKLQHGRQYLCENLILENCWILFSYCYTWDCIWDEKKIWGLGDSRYKSEKNNFLNIHLIPTPHKARKVSPSVDYWNHLIKGFFGDVKEFTVYSRSQDINIKVMVI